MINKGNFIRGLKNSNPKALDFIIEQYSNLIFKVAYSVLQNRELTEECMNDVFLKIWDNAKYFNKDSGQFIKWIMVMTKYTAIDLLRKEVRQPDKVDISSIEIGDTNNLDESLSHKENLIEVEKEINNMRPLDKEIFLRRFYLGQDTKEISKNIGISEKLINLKVFRGRKRLREKLINKGC